jgi:3-deoxy-D-manno-octulosonic-acid transferase
MKFPLSIGLLFVLYRLLWACTLPLLRLAPRLREGWAERCLKEVPFSQVDIWMHAASVGEAFIARELLANFSDHRKMAILITTNTSQGRAILEQSPDFHGHQVTLCYMPFDHPALVKKAVAIANPSLLVLIELEIWPALMAEMKQQQKQIIIVNGRMTTKSYKGYMKFPSLWKMLKPQRILAISQGNKSRLQSLFQQENSHFVSNIKFDRIAECTLSKSSGRGKTLILASIRRQEEVEVMHLITKLLALSPELTIELFPRHLQRVPHWQKLLTDNGIPSILHTESSDDSLPSVRVWDVFGELINRYRGADAAFIGGSLAPLGGQNFVECFMNGTIAVTGPFISDFLWAGDEVFRLGLVRKGRNTAEVFSLLVDLLENPIPKEVVRDKANRYIHSKQGGSRRSCLHIEEMLDKDVRIST